MAKAKTKKNYHHGDLKEALIQAALSLVEEKGAGGFTMREAARQAGVSPGAPYRHFKDRIQLMTEIAKRGYKRLQKMIESDIRKNKPSDPLTMYRHMGVTVVEFAAHNPAYFRVMHNPEFLDQEWLSEERTRERARVKEMLKGAQTTGVLSGHDLDALILSAQAIVHGLAYMFVDGIFEAQGIPASEARSKAWQVTEVLGYGLLPRKAPKL